MARILNRNSPDLDLGEYPPRRIEEDRLTSSPPVRGTPFEGWFIAGINRFIPACAGNTVGPDRPRPGNAVHPRLCGEHTPMIERIYPTTGSSPPVRGTQRR